MRQKNSESITRWKRSKNGLISHIYEHLASTFLVNYMSERSLEYNIDFDHWAHTYGDLLYLDFRLHTKKAAATLEKAYSSFQSSSVTFEAALKAAQQVAIEYQRPILEFDKDLVVALQELHEEKWKDISKLTVVQAEDSTSVNTVFSSKGISYGKKSPSRFEKITLHFEVNKRVYKNTPQAKALAVILIQAAALNFMEFLQKDALFYDVGDEWDWGSDTVAYRVTLSFSKSNTLPLSKIRQQAGAFLKVFNSSRTIRKVEFLMKTAYKNENSQYFSLETLNAITGGIVMGHAGWKQAAEKKLIASILGEVRIKTMQE